MLDQVAGSTRFIGLSVGGKTVLSQVPEVMVQVVTDGTCGAPAPLRTVTCMKPVDERSSENAVVVEHLRKQYGDKTAVDDVSFAVKTGEVFGILGTNGAGKTTTVEVVAGLRPLAARDRGTVRVLGLDPHRDRAAVRQVLGVQLQSAYLHGALTVAELIDLYRSFYPEPRGAEELLDLVGLGEQRRVRFEKLSGGQQQRVSIALAIAGRPRVVILDELTTGLDPRARRQMWRTIEQLRDEGCTVLLVSHGMEEVERLCDRVVLLDEGRILTAGTPAELVSQAGARDLDDAFVTLTGKEVEEVEA